MRYARAYLLDTNMVSYVIRNRSAAARRKSETIPERSRLLLSSICEAEILTGLARVPSRGLSAAFETFSETLERVPWDRNAAKSYAELDGYLRANGLGLALMDKLIAAHALALNATLVTHDGALRRVAPFLRVEDWATDL